MDSLDASIAATSRMITDLLGTHPNKDSVLLRSRPAILEDQQ
jgi:hypothetical protein